MHLHKGFELTKKYFPLAILAAALDLLNLGDIASRQQGFHVKFTIPSAVPSILQILPERPQGMGSVINFDIPFGYLGGAAILLFVVLLVLNAYVKGGFLGCVLEGIKGNPVDKNTFFFYAGRFWGRFLIQTIIMFAGVIFLGFLVLGLGFLAILFILVLLIAFFLLILWDYSLVVEDIGVVDAAERSWRLVVMNWREVLGFLLPIFLGTALFSIVASPIVHSPLIILAIFFYAFLGTAVVFAIMSFYLGLTGQEEGQAPLA